MSDAAPPERPAPVQDRNLMLILAYLWVAALVPLLSRTDAEVQWHARHGLVLMGVELAALVAWTTVFGLAWIMTGGLFGCVTTLQIVLTPIIGLLIVGCHVFLIVRALQGERVRLPRISELADRV
jgi:uncharacterized membrane protein